MKVSTIKKMLSTDLHSIKKYIGIILNVIFWRIKSKTPDKNQQ